MMFEEVESNIRQIIKHCLHQSISNLSQAPFRILPSQIIQSFPSQLNIRSHHVTESYPGGWQILNNYINCCFGFEVVMDNQTKSWISNQFESMHSLNLAFYHNQPTNIHNTLSAKHIKCKWTKAQNGNGIICTFESIDRYQLEIIPFVKCIHFDVTANQSENDEKCIESDDAYKDWYYEQYVEHYENVQIMDNNNDDDDEDIDLMNAANKMNIISKYTPIQKTISKKRRFHQIAANQEYTQRTYKRQRYNNNECVF